MNGQQQMMQPPFAPPGYQQYPGMAAPVNVTVNIADNTPSFALRVIWYIFIGWWLGAWWLFFGYFLCLTVIFLPLGLVMLNRLPWVLTLRTTQRQTSVNVLGGNVSVTVSNVQQHNFLIRAIYFLLVGWWLGGFWAAMGYLCCLTIVLLPVGLIMLNNLPFVLTLRRT